MSPRARAQRRSRHTGWGNARRVAGNEFVAAAFPLSRHGRQRRQGNDCRFPFKRRQQKGQMNPSLHQNTMNYDTIIVGGGIVGLATAYRLLEARPQTKLLLLEKESKLAAHQTGNNSGVLHSGLYFKPGSEKVRLSVSGLRQMVAFCREHGIAHAT